MQPRPQPNDKVALGCAEMARLKRLPPPIQTLSDSDNEIPLTQCSAMSTNTLPLRGAADKKPGEPSASAEPKANKVEDLPLKPQQKKNETARTKKPAAHDSEPWDEGERGSLEVAAEPEDKAHNEGKKEQQKKVNKDGRTSGQKHKKKAAEEVKDDVEAAKDESDAAAFESEPPKKKAKVEQDSTEPQPHYILMKYATHGKEGTYAVRVQGGKQFTEVNIPGAQLEQNKEVAEAIRCELNKGVEHDKVHELLSMLKSAMVERITKRTD